MTIQRIRALFYLAWHMILHLMRSCIGFNQSGLKRFRANYAGDHLPHFSKATQSVLNELTRCTHCRLCDLICLSQPVPAGVLPAFFVSSASRHAVGLDRSDFTGCSTCRACEASCPESIPIVNAIQALVHSSQ